MVTRRARSQAAACRRSSQCPRGDIVSRVRGGKVRIQGVTRGTRVGGIGTDGGNGGFQRGCTRSWTFLRLGRDERALDLFPLCSKRLRGGVGVERCLFADESFLSKSRKVSKGLLSLCCKRLRGLRSVRLVVLDRGDHRKARRARLAEAASASSAASSLTSRSCRSRARSPRRPCPTHGRAEQGAPP